MECGEGGDGQPQQRHEVSIPSLEDDSVLNVRVKYAGGVAAYFNGRLVVRFNLAASFDASTEAIPLHDGSLFHIILSSVDAVAGKNVMAFEVHRSTRERDCFRRERVFAGAGQLLCRGRHDNKEDLLRLNPTLFGSIPNEVGSYLW